jgi:hypothetical protein
MEATRPPGARRRPRRGTLEQPVDVRLVRNAFAFVAVAALVAAFTITRPGALAPSALPPSFDTPTAVGLAHELARDFPERTPGSPFGRDAAVWVSEKLALYGLAPTTDTWQTSLPGLGSVDLYNVVTTIPGTSADAIVVVAYRDNSAVAGRPILDNASGTAALVELARAYGRGAAGGVPVRPRHTLVFVSTDAGSYGGLGAERFARTSPIAQQALAVIVLDAIASAGAVRIAIDGSAPSSPAPALVRTAAARITAETSEPIRLAGWLQQLVDLGTPFGLGEQAPLLEADLSALRITTVSDGRGRSLGAPPFRAQRLGETGRAAQALLASLDSGVELVPQTRSYVYLGNRLVRGWAAELVLLSALIPFGVGVVDLLSRCRRMGIPLAPALRALRARLGVALWVWLLVVGATALGLFPATPSIALPPALPAATDIPRLACIAVGALALGGWLLARRRLVAPSAARAEDELAGHAVALAGLGVVAALTALLNPFALVFVLPSLFTWLWLPALAARAGWKRDVVYGLGLTGPLLFLVVTADRLGLGASVLPYTLRLLTTGYLPSTTALLLLAWAAIAAQLGMLTAGRYAPYAGGASPPPPGAVRLTTARVASWRQSRRRTGTTEPGSIEPSPRST